VLRRLEHLRVSFTNYRVRLHSKFCTCASYLQQPLWSKNDDRCKLNLSVSSCICDLVMTDTNWSTCDPHRTVNGISNVMPTKNTCVFSESAGVAWLKCGGTPEIAYIKQCKLWVAWWRNSMSFELAVERSRVRLSIGQWCVTILDKLFTPFRACVVVKHCVGNGGLWQMRSE